MNMNKKRSLCKATIFNLLKYTEADHNNFSWGSTYKVLYVGGRNKVLQYLSYYFMTNKVVLMNDSSL